MIKDIKCKNCKNVFTPKKNDKRIVYCDEKCRLDYRNRTKYTTKWSKENKEHVTKHRDEYKDIKNAKRRKKYATDEEYRDKVLKESKEYRIKNPTARRNNDLKNFYGITYEDYQRMIKEQNEKCKICGLNMTESDIQFNVDHCHDSGKVRGVLCSNCNFGIGHFKDNIKLLKNAIKYLEGSE